MTITGAYINALIIARSSPNVTDRSVLKHYSRLTPTYSLTAAYK
jgi:hypothetical protein